MFLQIQVFMPAKGDPAVGVVRTIVKDSRDTTDDLKGTEANVALDTDGRVNNFGSKPWNTVSNFCPTLLHTYAVPWARLPVTVNSTSSLLVNGSSVLTHMVLSPRRCQ